MTEVPTASVPLGADDSSYHYYYYYDVNGNDFWQKKGIHILAAYILPIVVFVGIIGNLITLAVLITKQFRKSPSSLILGALTLSDTGLLINGLHFWYTEGLHAIEDSEAASCTKLFFSYFLSFASPAFLVILTVERAISVFFPLKCREICSRRRILLCIITVTILLGLINLLPIISSLSYGHYDCSLQPSALMGAWFWIDSSLALFVPYILITIGNIFIITKLHISRRKLSTERSGERRTSSVTMMLIAVSACFLVLNMPKCLLLIGIFAFRDAWPLKTNGDWLTRQFLQDVTGIGFYVNTAINFIMYCLTGSKFREALKDLFARCACSCKL